MTCPSLEDLTLHLDPSTGRRTSSAAGAEGSLRAHLEAGCPACERRLAALEALAQDLTALVVEPASEATVAAATAVAGGAGLAEGRAPSAAARGALDVSRELIAELVPPGAVVPAFRSRSVEGQPYYFRADGYDIDVTLLESGALVGQVLPEDPSAAGLGPGDVYLYGPESAQATELRPTGEFHFASVAPGRRSIVVVAGGTKIVLPDADLGAD